MNRIPVDLPGFTVVETVDDDPVEVKVKFGRRKRVCPHCNGGLKRHGHSKRKCYDSPYFGTGRQYIILFKRSYCWTCNLCYPQELSGLPESVLNISSSFKAVLVTRRLRNYIVDSGKNNYRLKKELGYSYRLIKQIREFKWTRTN